MYKKVIFGVVIWFIFIAAAVFLQAKTKDIPLGQVKAEILQLITQSSPSKEIDEDERITYYYRNPRPAELVPILESALKQEGLINHQRLVARLTHFLATAIQKDMSKLEELKALQTNYSGKVGGVVKKVIEETNKYQPVSLKSPEDLELLWSEYKATGDKQIIHRTIGAICGSEESKLSGLRESARDFLIRKAPYHYEIHKIFVKKSGSSMEEEKYCFDEIVSTINRSSWDPANNHMWRGLNLLNLKKYDEALEEYRKGLSYFPDHPHIYANMANIYNRKQNVREAINSAKKAIIIDPEDDIPIYNLGLYYFGLKEYDEAIKCYLQVLKDHPKNAEYLRQLARAYHQKGDLENAAIYYKKHLEYGPEDAYVYAPLIKHYLTTFGKPVEEDPTDIAVMFQKKRFKDLEERLGTLLKEKAKDKEGRSQLSQAYHVLCNNSDYENLHQIKIKCLKEWLAQFPSSHFANACLGNVYIHYAWHARGGGWGSTVAEEAGRLLEERLLSAKEYLEKAYALDPSDPLVPASLITVAMGLGSERAEVEKQFGRGISADPTDSQAYLTKLTYLMPKWFGSKEEMFSFARDAARRAPSNSSVPTVLTAAHWEMYERSDSKGSYFRNPVVWKEMKEVYLTLSKHFPNSNKIPNWFARTAYLAGDYDTAREEFKIIGDDWLEGAWDNKKTFDEVKKGLLGD